MKIVFISICLFPAAFAQAPKGWLRTEPPKALENQVEFLGAWKDPNGKFNVRISKYQNQPPMAKIMGLGKPGDNEIPDPSIFPIEIASFPAPHLGLRFKLSPCKKHNELRHEYYWLKTINGLVVISVIPNGDEPFKLEDWQYGEIHPDKKGSLRAQFQRTVEELTPLLKSPPLIDVDTSLKLPIHKKADIKGPRIIVSIRGDGKLSIDGKLQSDEQLLAAMKKAAASDPKTVLHIRAGSTAEFKLARRVIRLGTKAGLSQVAFGAFQKDD